MRSDMGDSTDYTEELSRLLKANGAGMVGYADLQGISSDMLDGCTTGISIIVALNPQVIDGIQDGPTPQYYAEYNRVNSLLDKLGHLAAQYLTEHGERAEWLPATESFIDAETLSTPLPHKTAATRAGLGWIGKCALLVTREYGSAVRITTVLTDAAIATDQPVNASLCGDCAACVDACPGNAPSGSNWEIDLHRDSFFNAFACHEAAHKLARENIGVDNSICGKCIVVCPWTKKYLQRDLSASV
jgi:epoxyqueuosine reductase